MGEPGLTERVALDLIGSPDSHIQTRSRSFPNGVRAATFSALAAWTTFQLSSRYLHREPRPNHPSLLFSASSLATRFYAVPIL